MKQEMEKRFNEIYKDCVLVCIQLDSFSHRVFYIENGEKKIDEYSHYMGDDENLCYGRCNNRTIELFKNIPQTAKYDAKEIIYIEPKDLYKYIDA